MFDEQLRAPRREGVESVGELADTLVAAEGILGEAPGHDRLELFGNVGAPLAHRR
jgi:hypothetical protein